MAYRLTPENAPRYEGKVLDSRKRLFHYYPIKPIYNHKLGWCFTDRNGVTQKIPKEGIYFEEVKESVQGGIPWRPWGLV